MYQGIYRVLLYTHALDASAHGTRCLQLTHVGSICRTNRSSLEQIEYDYTMTRTAQLRDNYVINVNMQRVFPPVGM